MFGIIISVIVLITMGYLILKNYKPQVVLAAAGIFLMMCGVWLGFGGVLDPTKSSGYLIVDIYNEILRMLSNRIAAAELQKAVHDNLRNLGLDVLDVVNLRVMMGDGHGPAEGSIEASLTVLAEMQQQGLVKHIGLSNVTPTQVAEARKIAEIVCVQNEYNIAHRADDAMIDALAHDGIAYVPFFPLGGFTPLQSSTLSDVAASLGATPMQVALAWLLQRSPNILLIPGTSSVAHLRENMAAEKLHLSEEVLSTLDGISRE